ncbi:MAG TPA: hypothetical protein VK604_03330 [Bryobacteraceae bacterium]|nr:hypothetical protein [Bryobacteraceae bacterium]HTF69491.1 hypothetical protein [Edaphobacter sp.]
MKPATDLKVYITGPYLEGGATNFLQMLPLRNADDARKTVDYWLNVNDKIGTVTPGKQADLVLVQGNPAAKISDVRNVKIVFKDGVGYDPGKLIQSVTGSVGLH